MLLEPVVYSLLAAAVLLSLAWRPWRPEPTARGAWFLTALAFATSYVLAEIAIRGVPLPPKEAGHWLALCVPATLLIAPLEGGRGARRTALWLGRVLLSAGFLWTASQPLREYRWEARNEVLWLGVGLAIWLLQLGAGADLARRRASGPSLPCAYFVALVGGAVALGLSGSVVLAHLAGALAPALGALCIAGMWRPELELVQRSTAPVVFVLPGLLAIGAVFSSTSWTAALLLLVAPQLARVPVPGASERVAAIVRALIVAVPAGIAVWLSIPEADPYGGY